MNYSVTSSTRPSDALAVYDNVITIKTAVGEVPLYKFIEKFLYIEDRNGVKIPFILNEDQVELYKEMCEQKLRGDPIRIDILKARQKGFSTFIAGVIFSSVIFQAGQKAAIVADIAEHARNLFQKYKFFYDNLPEELKLERVTSNANEVVVKHKNGQTSSIRIMVQGDRAGRSGTYQYLHLSECAFWQNLEETLTSLLQTVNNNNLNSMVFIETTANGMNDYKLRWDNDFADKSRYLAKFYPWFTTREYRVSRLRLKNYPDWLSKMCDEYHIDNYQAEWYYEKYTEFNGDIDKLKQEFPSNPVEAFITSGNYVFNAELLQRRKLEIIANKNFKTGVFSYRVTVSQDGKRMQMDDVKFVESRLGSVKIYKEPIDGHPYVVCNDPAMGGEDYFATQVFDNYTGEQVAVYHRNKCDADDAAFQMYCLAREYNNALITGETNTTSYLLEVCSRLGYSFIYQDQDVEDLSNRYMNKFGYKTKQNNRTYMIDLFKQAFRDNPNIINDYDTICEMETFQIVKMNSGKEKAEATGGNHDDLVMAACGFYLCRGAQTCVPNVRVNKKKMSIDELEERVNANRRKIQDQKERRNVFQIWD